MAKARRCWGCPSCPLALRPRAAVPLTRVAGPPQVLSVLANWTSILVGTFINFIVPPLLYRAACSRYPTLDDEDDEEAPAEDAPWKLLSVRTGPLETVVSGVVLGESAPELT